MKVEAQEKLIQALLAAQRTEHEAQSEPNWWDHSPQREPLLVKLPWEELAVNIDEQVMLDFLMFILYARWRFKKFVSFLFT